MISMSTTQDERRMANRRTYVHGSISVRKGVVLPLKRRRSDFERPFTLQNQPVRPRLPVKTRFRSFPTFYFSMFENFVFSNLFDFFGVGNPLDVVFVRILTFLKKTDHATRSLAVFCFRWTCSQHRTSKKGPTSVRT